MIKKINIESIPHESQNYETVGDYWIDNEGVLQIRVSDMQSENYFLLVGLHEMVEFFLCKHKGITNDEITKFDLKFESERKEGNFDEPGFDSEAPYREQHLVATGIEMIVASKLDVDWKLYDKKVNEL